MAKPQSAAFTIVPVVPEDMAPLVHLSYGARKSSDFVMATFPMSAKTDEERLAWALRRAASRSGARSALMEIKAITTTGKILGSARWRDPAASSFLASQPEPEMAKEQIQEKEWIQSDLDPLLYEQLKEGSARAEKEAFPGGEPHWVLENMMVAKESQGLGVGSALLQWGLEKADAEGLPVFLLSSEEGYELYSRRGFQVLETFVLNCSDGRIFDKERAMLRPVKGVAI